MEGIKTPHSDRDYSSGKEKIIVVGAGISGLAAGFRLRQQGFEVKVLELENEIGGRMSSFVKNGFTVNRAANILPGSYDTIRQLAIDAGLGNQIPLFQGTLGTIRDGKIYHMRSDGMVLDGFRTGLFSWKSKLLMSKMLMDGLKMKKFLNYVNLGDAARFDMETASEYCDRRLNAELKEYLVQPVIRALYAVSAERVSVVDFFFAVFNFVGSGFMGYPGGINFLVNELSKHVGVTTGAKVIDVEKDDGRVTVTWEQDRILHTETASACVIAVTGKLVPGLYPQMDARQRYIMENVYEYSTTFNAHLGLGNRPDEPAMIVQVPPSEGNGLCVVTFDHNSSPRLVPQGKGKLSTYWLHDWCEDRIDLSDDEILEEMFPFIERVVPGVSKQVEMTHIDRWSPAILMSKPGVYSAMKEFAERIDTRSRVQLAGDYLTATSTNGCALSGELAAKRITGILKDNR